MTISKFNTKLDDNFALLKLSREGISFSLFLEIVKSSAYSIKEWSRFLHIKERTIQRYKKESKTFEPIQSERIIEIVQLKEKGEDVFGSKEKFNKWMNSNIVALGGIEPVTLLDSSFGIDILMNELGRIEHGILA